MRVVEGFQLPLFLALLICLHARAEIVATIPGKPGITRFMDVPASFGPRIDSKGMQGGLVIAQPDLYACQGPLIYNQSYEGPTFVLVQRSPVKLADQNESQKCSFEAKVRLCQAAGFDLVVVFDSVDEAPIRMKSETEAGITVPSVFLSLNSGTQLMELVQEAPEGVLHVFVDNSDPYPLLLDSLNMTMLGLICGFLFVVLVCGTLFLCSGGRAARLVSAPKNEVLPLSDVLALPEVTVGSHCQFENDSCPVCLEDYRAGDTLRLLPCRHAFHTDCIAPWLTERQRTCPLCKEDVNPSATDPLLARRGTDEEALRGTGTGTGGGSDAAVVINMDPVVVGSGSLNSEAPQGSSRPT